MIDREKLKQSLSNFYTDYGYTESNINFFLDMFEEMWAYLDNYLASTRRNQVITSMETFKKYNFAAFKTADFVYRVEDILMVSLYCNMVGIQPNLPMSDKLIAWEMVPKNPKIAVLKRANKFLQISARRPFDDIDPEIISMDLYLLDRQLLVRDVDYYLEENKLYLIGRWAFPSTLNTSLYALNVFVDYNTPERLIGSRLGLGYSSSISKTEYRDFIQMVAYVLVKGPTVKNLKNAFSLISGWEGSNIIDMKGATGARKGLWTSPSAAILTPFDFLVTIPASLASTVGYDDLGNLVSKEDRIDVFRSFLDIVKPADTDYLLALSVIANEIVPPNEEIKFIIECDPSDMEDPSDSAIPRSLVSVVEEFVHGQMIYRIRYDNGETYDSDGAYDIDSLSPVGPPGTLYGDAVSINKIEYPPYPVNFTGSVIRPDNYVRIILTEAAENVESYDIIRKNEATGVETLITNIPYVGTAGLAHSYNDMTFSALSGGTVVKYYARSVYHLGEVKNVSRNSVNLTFTR